VRIESAAALVVPEAGVEALSAPVLVGWQELEGRSLVALEMVVAALSVLSLVKL